MATGQQVALSRPNRAASSPLNSASRQVVPQFLLRLYEMVNDSGNDCLIRWSDSGDSFFVLDHERLAKEQLGRFFKHQNFSSFVRQLNMYGFHKIPHIQQGVLRPDSDTEFWNFAHPNFRRGRFDLLCHIQRKNKALQPNEDALIASVDPQQPSEQLLLNSTLPSLPPNSHSPGQLLDINTIINGLSVIKRHQSAISNELTSLKAANNELWREARLARDRHTAQQDTINRILKFLAGVFGPGMTGVRTPTDAGSPKSPAQRTTVPRASQRLMIEHAPRNQNKSRAPRVTDVLDNSDSESAPTPLPADSPAPLGESTPFFPAVIENASLSPSTGTSLNAASPQPSSGRSTPKPTTPSADAAMHAALSESITNQEQVQLLLAALAAQTSFSVQPSDQSSAIDQPLSVPFSPYSHLDFTPALPAPTEESLLTDSRIAQGYEDTEAISKKVDVFSENIDSIMACLGLDPGKLETMPTADPLPTTHVESNDFYANFLNEISAASGDGDGSEDAAANETGAAQDESIPINLLIRDEGAPATSSTDQRDSSPEVNHRRAVKRKSDFIEDEPALSKNAETTGGSTVKRKR